MNEAELKKIWQGYDQKIDSILHINKQQLNAILSEKADSRIRSFKKNHILSILLGFVWLFFLIFLFYNAPSNIFFKLSVGMIILFNVFAVLLYIYHLILLSQIDVNETITTTQTKLTRVSKSYVQVGRILLLQTPFYCTWWYSYELIQNGGVLFWTINLTIVTALTSLSIWLFINLSSNRKPKSWAKKIDNWFGVSKLHQAVSFLKEIEEFKDNETTNP